MDILAHALYGATFCSRSGLAGGRKGVTDAHAPFTRDWTVWAAAGFGVFPDLASIGVSFLLMWSRGELPSFHALPPHVFVLYHSTHSLVFAGLVVLALWMISRPLALAAVAWPIHIVMDSFFHAEGWWQTMMFYPLSDWFYDGVNWWQHPNVILLYWVLLPVLWLGMAFWRKGGAGLFPLERKGRR